MVVGGSRFLDRADAGRVLGAALREEYAGRGVAVLGLPRGGVLVAAEVAAALGVPVDALVVAKVATPSNPELALGAVTADGPPVVNAEVVRAERVSVPDLERMVEEGRAWCVEGEARWRGGRSPADVAGRTVLLVDDGLATGATMRAAVAAVRARGADRVVAAVPVGPRETLRVLAAEADAVVCLRRPLLFRAVGWAYERFGPPGDDQVVAALGGAR